MRFFFHSHFLFMNRATSKNEEKRGKPKWVKIIMIFHFLLRKQLNEYFLFFKGNINLNPFEMIAAEMQLNFEFNSTKASKIS